VQNHLQLFICLVVDRHRFDADPNPDFHVAVADSDWHQCDVDPHAGPTPSFAGVVKSFFFAFSQSFASLQCFTFLISVKDVIIFSFLNIILKFLLFSMAKSGPSAQ
jgi:hypothetical protein